MLPEKSSPSTAPSSLAYAWGPPIVRRASSSPASPIDPNLHPVLNRIYQSRGIISKNALDLSLGQLLGFDTLSGIGTAVELLETALRKEQRFLFIGDFDADGATSCALGVRALRALGAKSVDYLVPNRFEFGYGLTPELVEVAALRAPDVLITVDNGIASHEGVVAANARGMKVLITDHHLPGKTLPPALAIVNPNMVGDTFPSKSIAGVGVIFYVMVALRAHLRSQHWFAVNSRREPNLAVLLDIVALGTVADVVTLDHNNRILVAQGLARIRHARAHPGIRALLEVSGREPEYVSAADLSFAVAPRLNAAGRLDDMSLGIECLLSDDPQEAAHLASRLNELNLERRDIEANMRAEAEQILKTLSMKAEGPNGLCLFDEHWHPGVIGIVAGRIKERSHRPTIVFAPDPLGGLKGSARSIKEINIRDVLDAIATNHPGMIDKFGGHAMAAGVSLSREKFPAFTKAFDTEVSQMLGGSAHTPLVLSDGALSDEDLTLDFAEQLQAAGPWGQEFEEPIFDDEFQVLHWCRVGDRHLRMRLATADGMALDALAFNSLEAGTEPEIGPFVHAAYRLEANLFRGKKRLQLIVEHFTSIDFPRRSAENQRGGFPITAKRI